MSVDCQKMCSTERKAELAAIMADAGSVIDRLYKMAKPAMESKLAEQRLALANKSTALTCFAPDTKKVGKSLFVAAVFKAMQGQTKSVSVFGVTVSADDAAKILRAKAIEFEVLEAYEFLLKRHARIYTNIAKSVGQTSVDFDDLFDEARLKLLNCIYFFQFNESRNNKFTTLLVSALKRHLGRFINSTNLLGGLSNNAIELLNRASAAKVEENRPMTFDELSEKLNLSAAEREMLEDVNRHVCVRSSLTKNEKDAISQLSAKGTEQIINILPELMEKAKLDPFAKMCVTTWAAAGTDDWGWALKLANEQINPVTGKHYSKMAPLTAVRRGLASLRKAAGEAA